MSQSRYSIKSLRATPIWVLYQAAKLLASPCDAAELLVELAARTGNSLAANECYRQAYTQSLMHKCDDVVARSAVGLAYVLLSERDYVGAEGLLQGEMDRIRRSNNPQLLVEALLKLGVASDKQGDQRTALASWHEAADLAQSVNYDFGYSEAMSNLGGIAYREHRDDEARSYWLQALQLTRFRRDWLKVAELDLYLGIIDLRGGATADGLVHLRESRVLYEKHGRHELADKAASFIEHATAGTSSGNES